MAKRRRYGGFSLVEVLLAIATLAIGMMFIGGTFLAGVYFSTVSTERTIATVVANEAFSKIKLFGVDMADPNLVLNGQKLFDYQVKPNPLYASRPIDPNEFAYPSTRTLADKQYFWSALCRRAPKDPNNALVVTVFVSRKVGTATQYVGPAGPLNWPVPMPIRVVAGTIGSRVLTIEAGKERWINEGYTIVGEDSTGQKYRVVERGVDPAQVILDQPWLGGNLVWAVPPPSLLPSWVPPALPPVGGGGPCIVVYQTEIRF
jgi:type II secretory pathway pseudopilin PulG